MKIEIRPELSTQNPDDVSALAARGDYLETSLVGKNIHDVLQGVSTDSDEYDPDESLRALHKKLIHRGHFGCYEHPQAFFVAEGISRPCMAQITRHRHMSFDVQSQRYANFSDSPVKTPDTFTDEDAMFPGVDKQLYEGHAENAVEIYDKLVEKGIPKEDARFVLPLGTTVNMSFSANIRTLFHFIDMRHSGDCQWEIIEFAEQVLEACSEWAPISFEMYKEYAKGSSKKAP